MKYEITLQGSKELARLLTSLPKAMEEEIVKEACDAGAEVVLASIQSRTPVRTGKLREKLRIVPARARYRGLISALVTTPTRAELGVSKDDPYYWPAALEYGHSRKLADGRIKSTKAFPFMRDGFDAAENQAADTVRRKVEEGVDRVVVSRT